MVEHAQPDLASLDTLQDGNYDLDFDIYKYLGFPNEILPVDTSTVSPNTEDTMNYNSNTVNALINNPIQDVMISHAITEAGRINNETQENDNGFSSVQIQNQVGSPRPLEGDPFIDGFTPPSSPENRPVEPAQISSQWSGGRLRCKFQESKFCHQTDVQTDFRKNKPVNIELGRTTYPAIFIGLVHSNVEFSKVTIDGTEEIGTQHPFQVSRTTSHLIQPITVSNSLAGVVHGFIVHNDGEENVLTTKFLMESQSSKAPGGRREAYREWKIFAAPLIQELMNEIDTIFNFLELPHESILRRWEAPIQVKANFKT